MGSGARCAGTAGTSGTLPWSAENWDRRQLVRGLAWLLAIRFDFSERLLKKEILVLVLHVVSQIKGYNETRLVNS